MRMQPGSGGSCGEQPSTALQLWGGHECTVNRVGDAYFDQTVRTGHHDRLGDLELFADIGFKALRYPVLWERVSPERPDRQDWRWTDERLAEIRRLGMRPIAGLCHHGSGPRYTSLLSPDFAAGLARHARAAAERYPWITEWTPVNEPLTTARFSALYGHWYPHNRDETAFFVALMNQIDAVRLAMKAIREVIPGARLIQTDDLGHTLATPPLQHQADFDNERRWLGWDLLTGRLRPTDLMWARMEGQGLGERVRAMVADPCPPDVIGVNYYLSSERFLDHRANRYPAHHHGANFGQTFADVETVRAVAPGTLGVERMIESAWLRYRLPVAVTECHNGCTREEQMRWLNETWDAAVRLRARGVPVEAVTVWSLLGSCDWNRLLTVDAGHYETGVYDVRMGGPRPTAMVELCRRLARHDATARLNSATPRAEPLPAVAGPGWWSRDIRFIYEPVWVGGMPVRRNWTPAAAASRPVLITGATGVLGQAFARACEHRGLAFVLTDRAELAIDDEASIAAGLERLRPWAVINAAGWVRVDEAEADPAGCMRANADAVALLAQACRRADIRLATFSSDLVFDGETDRPYVETDAPSPLSVYGRSKAQGERVAVAAGALVIRTAAFFSPHDPYNFAHHLTRTLARNAPFDAAGDCVVSPTYVPDLVEHALDLLIDDEAGIWHLANPGAVTWAAFAQSLARALDLNPRLVRPVSAADMGWAAPRPAFAALGSRRGRAMPDLTSAIARYADAIRPTLRTTPTLVQPPAPLRPRAPGVVTAEIKSFAPKIARAGAAAKALDA